METFCALLAICAGNSPAFGEFPAQRPVTRSFDVFFDLCLNKRLRKQSWGWWFETLSRPSWRHCNGIPNLSPLQWHHNECDDVSNHQCLECLLSRLFWRRSKKTSKLHVTGLCEGTSDFPAQRASNVENVSIWWCHHASWFLTSCQLIKKKLLCYF